MGNRGNVFDDVAEATEGLGVLGGEGATFLEKTSTRLSPQGITTRCTCGQCGKPNDVTVDYAEAVIGGLRLLPPYWQQDQKSGDIFCNVGCASCNYQLKLLFTPQELARLVDQAVKQGDVSQQDIQGLVAQTKARAGMR